MLQKIKRILKHRWRDVGTTQKAIPPDMVARLQQRVAASEKTHSGEIRIYIESGLPLSYLRRNAPLHHIIRQRAVTLFGKLRVWDTANNNGVLIYLLLAEHAIELVADRGLNEAVDPLVWQAMVARMSQAFKRGQFEDGLTQALNEVSALLNQHFPLGAGQSNHNELPDTPLLR
ncbi:MAG: TPM domain-containing protein [Pseudomonadota bacterium]